MTKEELIDLINKLESQSSKDIALFEINQYGGGADESFVRANRDGLQLFAAELLKASLVTEELALATEKKVFHFENEEILDNSEIGIHYIEPTLEERKKADPRLTIKESPWKDKLIKGGCITVVVILVAATIIGLVEILKWLF